MAKYIKLLKQRICLGVLAILVMSLSALPASAKRTTLGAIQHTFSMPLLDGPSDPQELEAFMDALLGEQMEALHIPGAVFVLLKDGEVFFAKGYGYADIEKRRPVDPDRTLFQAGSVAKLFTATAIMQLAERGQLDLDDPVNDHLRAFQIEERYSKPVTIGDLLTHTGGFEERLVGMGALTPEELVPLGSYLGERMPSQVMPPGDQISYSNHGYALAGYLVEEISGMSFEGYIEENIFKPLGMERSSFRQPLPEELDSDRAVGYIYASDFQAVDTPYFNAFPAGGLYTTGTDMASFMIAHLQDGQYGEGRILEQGTAQVMHQRQFTHHPQMEGWTYGFYEHVENGQRALVHAGDHTGFASLTFILPEQDMGFFVSFNASLNISTSRDELVSQFLDHYYPATELSPPTRLSADMERFAGKYRWNRYARTTIDRAIGPMEILQWSVKVGNDGVVTLSDPSLLGGKSSQWVQVEPLLFQNLDGDGHLAFRQDEDGRITHMFMTFGGPAALEKVSWYETDTFHLGLITLMVLAFLSVLIWPTSYLLRRLRGWLVARSHPAPSTHRRQWFGRRLCSGIECRQALARSIACLLGVLNLVFLAGLGGAVAQSLSTQIVEVSPILMVLLAVPFFTGFLSFVSLIYTVLAWRDGYWSILGRLHYTLVALAALSFTWWVNYWNLLGWRF